MEGSDHIPQFPWTLARGLTTAYWVTGSEPEGAQKHSSDWIIDGIKEL